MLIAGLAGLVAGAMSMAAGEYVSVSSQTDAEKADVARETRELAETPEAELEELTQIYVERGLDRDLAEKVAVQLTERDALGSHARDELGHLRDRDGASDPGRGRVRADLRGWRRRSPDRRAPGSAGADHVWSPHRRSWPSLFWADWGLGRWRRDRSGCRTRDVLGCACHGRHCCGRDDFWGECMIEYVAEKVEKAGPRSRSLRDYAEVRYLSQCVADPLASRPKHFASGAQ